MIDFYTWSTPNGRKVSIMLEETGLAYEAHAVDITKDQQFEPDFLKIAPNNRIPAIVDRDTGQQLFESGAILMYLAKKTGQFWPAEGEAHWRVVEWLMWQMGGPGPMLGQVHHFVKYNQGKAPYAEERYLKEGKRLYGVLDRRLGEAEFVAGDYSIADMAIWPWISRFEWQGIDLASYSNVARWYTAIAARPAVQRGYDVPVAQPRHSNAIAAVRAHTFRWIWCTGQVVEGEMMTDKNNFSGVIAPVLTPFGQDGAPDPDRFIEHAEWLMSDEGGCTGLAPFGTTSEANSMGFDERMEILEDLVDAGIEPLTLMPGTGTCSMTDTVILTQHAMDLGCGGVLMLPPFYYKQPSEEGLFRYFADVIDEVGDDRLRIYLYHIPPVAQVGFPLTLIERLRQEFPETVVGLKDSSGDWSNMKAILDAFPDFELFPGSELFLLDGLRNGSAGVISASANVSGRKMRAVFDDWKADEAEKLQAEVSAMRKTIQSFPMIPVLKAIVAHYRKDNQWRELRPPFEALSEVEAKRAVTTLMEEHNFKLDIDLAA